MLEIKNLHARIADSGIEIIRGPASLLFGSSASGGAVNIFDRRIPRSVPEEPFHVDALATYGSAADERSGALSIDLPLTANLVFHADGAYGRTDDLRIGGFQVAPGLRADLLRVGELEGLPLLRETVVRGRRVA